MLHIIYICFCRWVHMLCVTFGKTGVSLFLFSLTIFIPHSNLMKKSCKSITVSQITTKFCSCHDSPAVMSYAKICSNPGIICIATMRDEWLLHRVWNHNWQIFTKKFQCDWQNLPRYWQDQIQENLYCSCLLMIKELGLYQNQFILCQQFTVFLPVMPVKTNLSCPLTILLGKWEAVFLYPLLQRSWKGGILVSRCPSVCPSVYGQNHVRSVTSTILARSISYLHILLSNFRRCVACEVFCKILGNLGSGMNQ